MIPTKVIINIMIRPFCIAGCSDKLAANVQGLPHGRRKLMMFQI